MIRRAVLIQTLILSVAVSFAGAAEIPFEQNLVSTDLTSGVRLTTGDMDGDGDADLVTTRSVLGSDAEWWENDGSDDPDWIRRTIGPTGSIANVADVDSDGDLDLFAVGFPFVSWFDNDGSNPPVWTQRTIDGTETGLRSITPGDLNGDGHLDAVGANQFDNAVRWYENDGATPPVWTTRTIDAALPDVHHVEVGDFNADGRIDVVAITESPGQLVWYENDGAAIPGFTKRVIDSFGGPGWQCKVADLDGDGDLDVVASQPPPLSDVTWYENDGASPPGWTARIIDNNGSFVPSDLVVIDFDLDGDIDVASASSADDKVRWHENDGSSPPVWTNRTVTLQADNPNDLTVGDFDGDGDVDLATLSTADNELAIYENRTIHRNAPFAAEGVISSTAGRPGSVFAADVDGDGDLDALSSSTQDGIVAWYENDGATPPSWTPRTITNTAGYAISVFAVDLDGDGDLDALSASRNGNTVAWHENDGGSPPGPWTQRVITSTATTANSVFAADVDGDGDMDALSASEGDDTIAWYENDGGSPPGPWTKRVITNTADGANTVVAADVDGDGDLDALSASQFDLTVAWYENDGGSPPGPWTKRVISSTAGAYQVYAVDVDGDGDLDALSGSQFDQTVSWYENDGSSPPGPWTKRVITDTADLVFSVNAADVDGDGDLDALSASAFDDTVAWYENDGGSPPGWTKRVITTAADFAFWVITADVDGDGDLDALSASLNDDTVAWYENVGGQFGFTGADQAGGLAFDGEATAILEVVAKVNGRSGDSVGRLTTLKLEALDANGGVALSSGQANALIENVHIYRDADGSGTFDADVDTLVLTEPPFGGVQTVVLPAAGPNVLVAAPVSFFVVPELTADASTQPVNTFAISHLSETGPSTVVDASAGIQLLSEFSPDFQGQTISIATAFAVDSTTDAVDANPGDGVCATAGAQCTLRAALQEANALTGDNRIVLPAGTYTLSIPGRGEEGSATGDLDIAPAMLTDWTYIVGEGPGQTIIDGGGLDRVLHVNAFRMLSLENLTVQGGDTTSTTDSGGGVRVSGFNNATLVIRNCEFRDNASGFGGGAIYSSGTATITDSLFRDNFENGGLNGDAVTNASSNAAFMEIVNSTFSGNVGGGAPNGAIGTQGAPTTIVRGCTLSENTRGIAAVNVQVENSIVSGNVVVDISGSSFTSLGHNFVGNTSNPAFVDGINGDQVGSGGSPLDAKLGPLGDNGGSTLTYPLQATSPAIDAGSCGVLTEDQRGESRPVDIPGVTDVDDGCDIGAFEAKLGQTQAPLSIPVRWCGVNGAPSIDDPTVLLDGDTTADQVLRKRHEKIADEIYIDQTNVSFVSAANAQVPSFPLIDDPICASGCPIVGPGSEGDVFVDPDTMEFNEFDEVIATCRKAWHILDPTLQGITGVQIGRFVNDSGTPIGILGIGGRPEENDPAEQVVAGRVMVVDRLYRLDLPGNPSPPNPEDLLDQLLGHEMGHALSLRHGDGVDNDDDGILDNDDEKADNLPRLDGINLMQYRNGTKLTSAQGAQIRAQASATIPDVVVQSLSDAIPDERPISEETVEVLEYGYGGLSGVDVQNAIVKKFENAIVRKFQNAIVKKFQNAIVKKFKNAIVKRFENADIPHFGMAFTGTAPGDSAIPHMATGTLPWPAPIEYRTFYHSYLDLDSNDATGAYPADKANPSDPGNNFPGVNNFQAMPDLTEEAGIDLISQIEMWAVCTTNTCDTFSELRVFDYNDGTGVYEEVLFENDTDITARGLGLYQQLDSEYVESEEVPAGMSLQPRIPVSTLTAAGLAFESGRPKPIRMEVVASIECSGNVINDDPSSAVVDCQCTDCASCPDYPGCVAGVGTPDTLNGSRIVTDCATGVLTYEPPRLPQCSVSPGLAGAGQAVTAYLSRLPTTIAGQTVEISLDETLLGSAPTGSIDADGNLAVPVTLPVGTTGALRLSARITGSAVGVDCTLDVTPTVLCLDTDGDGDCDSSDTDDDNDGVLDGTDPEPLNPLSCGDSDLDTCDDCSSGTNDPANDGPDLDLDGDCDAFDTDDDGDGVADASDCAPLDSTIDAAASAVTGLTIAADTETIEWDGPLPGDGGGTQVDVLRSTVDQLPVGSGAETCVGSTGGTSFSDDSVPAMGAAYGYLLRRTNVCGGTYGFESGGGERLTTTCP